jgi:DNA-binding response OmpR family regulator
LQPWRTTNEFNATGLSNYDISRRGLFGTCETRTTWHVECTGSSRSREILTPGPHQPLILLVEDDSGLATMVTDWFASRHYGVCHVESASEAELALDAIEPDIIILDLMLPDRNGLTVCARLKQRSAAPLIICSATRRSDDAVIGLQLGADDFLRKPFSLDELQARIDLALRRGNSFSSNGQTAAPSVHQFGGVTVDISHCVATSEGNPIPLTPTEFRLLETLASRAPQLVLFQDLASGIWGAVDDGVLHSLGVHMRRLRTKLAAAAPRVRLVTRRGFGYQLIHADA